MKGSIFRRFTLLSVLIAFTTLIPLVVFGLYAMQVASDYFVRKTLEELKRDVLVDAEKLKRSFDIAQGDLPVLSQFPTMRELVRAKAGTNQIEIARAKPPVEQAFLTFSRNRKLYSRICYLDENGQEVVRVDYDGTQPPWLIPWERLRIQRQRDYFSETMKLGLGQVYTSSLDLNRHEDQIETPYRPVIRYATPLFDDAGHRRGIVMINLMAGPLLDALYQEAKAARKVVYVVDQEGFYLLHPDSQKRWGGPVDLNTGERLQHDFPTLSTYILSRQAVATVVGGQVITAQSLDLSSSRSGPFLVIVELMPTHIVLAPVSGLRLYLLILLVGVGALTLMGAVLLGEKLARPIVALEKAAHQIQQGDLKVRVEAGGSHEIAALGEAFNTMAEGLVQARSQIERQLAELMAHQRRWEGLHRLEVLLSQSLRLEEVYPAFAHAVKVLVPYDRIRVVVPEETQFRMALSIAEPPLVSHQGQVWPKGAGCTVEWVLAHKTFKLVQDLETEATFCDEVYLVQEGIRSTISIPLLAGGEAMGVLSLDHRMPYTFSREDLELLGPMAEQLALAIHNARLYEEQRLAAIQLAAKVEELERTQSCLIEGERLRAMGQMAAGVAHDFNNALMGVLGQAQLMRLFLEQGPVAYALQGVEGYADLLECLTRQEQAAHDAAETIRKIREATRPRGTEAFGPVALSGVVEQVCAITRPRWKDQAEAVGVQIIVRTALAETPPVLGHAAELREALTNLIFNALDAVPLGGTVTIATQQVTGDFVELTVTDTGTGMSQAVQARLFEPFFSTKGVRGTGLGLSMVRGIISRHEGEIKIKSAEGKGTTVTLRLPVAMVADKVVPPPAAPLVLSGPLKLLVIDDEPLLAKTLNDLLCTLGHEAAIATSGKEGLALLAAERFDLVLTDLGMAEVSGWDVALAVKARWPELPVILVTGWGDEVEREDLNGTGVDLILAKPYTVAQLKHALAKGVALTRRRGDRLPIGMARSHWQ